MSEEKIQLWISWAVIGLIVAIAGAKGVNRARLGAAFLAAWLLPGAGHAILGKWRKGLFFFVALGLTYVAGLWLSGWHTVSFEDNHFYFLGQFGSGATWLLGILLGDPKAFPREDLPKSWYDPGLLYVCVVGLLNLVIAINVLDAKPSAVDAKPAAPPAPAAGGTAQP